MTGSSAIYGGELAAAKQAIVPTWYLALADVTQQIIKSAEVHPELGTVPMFVLAPPLSPTTPAPVIGDAKILILLPQAATVFGAQLAAAVGAPPLPFYVDACQAVIDVLVDCIVPATGLLAPPGGGVVTGSAKVQTTKDAQFYGEAFAAKSKCPAASSQAKQYADMVRLTMWMLRDAEVPGAGLISPPPPIPPGTPVVLPITGTGGIV